MVDSSQFFVDFIQLGLLKLIPMPNQLKKVTFGCYYIPWLLRRMRYVCKRCFHLANMWHYRFKNDFMSVGALTMVRRGHDHEEYKLAS